MARPAAEKADTPGKSAAVQDDTKAPARSELSIPPPTTAVQAGHEGFPVLPHLETARHPAVQSGLQRKQSWSQGKGKGRRRKTTDPRRKPGASQSPIPSSTPSSNISQQVIQTPSTPSIVMSSPSLYCEPTRESPLLSVLEVLHARHGAGYPVGDKSPLFSPTSRASCQIPWLSSERQQARRGGLQLLPGLDYKRVEEVYGKFRPLSGEEGETDDSEEDMNDCTF